MQEELVAYNDAETWFKDAQQLVTDTRDSWRGVYLPSPQGEQLDYCCNILHRAFKSSTYLVGSVLRTKNYRDVDVRMIMDDDKFYALFGKTSNPIFWSLLCTSISTWLSKVTELPIDFQIQSQTSANAMHRGPRNALGIFTDPVAPFGNFYVEKEKLPLWLQGSTPDDDSD